MSVKDLRLVGRDIKKTIIIDNLRENFWSTCPENGIEILSWYGDDLDDIELQKLIPFLKSIVINEEPDVRKVIKKYRDDFEKYVNDFTPPAKGSKLDWVKTKKQRRKELNSVIV